MYKSYNLFLPISKRNIKIDICIPRFNKHIKFDTLYMLDGQNAFKDRYATFGRSLRAGKTFKRIKKNLNKNILGVAIYNSEPVVNRIDEYSPFIIDNIENDEWIKNDIKICESFCEDFINTIIPFIENNFNVNKNANNRFIYGSSLAAVTVLYLGFKYNVFNYIGAFSTASFLYKDSFINFLDNSNKLDKNVFLYVGENESSDNICDSKMYLDTSINLYNYFNDNKVNTTLITDKDGIHNEKYWDKYLFNYLKFIYKVKW